ncbi:hypothetical protein [Nitrosopumilus sp.]|uniref:hypothetical protein n=1 Tax=Nitrosopumilus sp. TaxID=2024843 RepID=UPI0034A0887F
MNEEEKKLLLEIAYGDTWLENVDGQKLKQAIKSVMQEIDEQKNIQRTAQGEEIIIDDEIIHDEEEYL